MKKILATLLLFPMLIQGQEILYAPEPKLITRFPFKQYSGGVMVVRAVLENIKDSLNFILDTGSGGISLDSSTCEEFKIATTPTDTTINGIGGRRKVDFVFGKTLHLPGLELQGLNFHINNYDVLTSVYGEKIDGVIGYSFFRKYVVKINFDSLYIEVLSPGEMKYPRRGFTLHPAFTSIPILAAGIRDRRQLSHNFYFDTGAGLCLLLSDQYVRDSSILLSKRKPKLTQAEGVAGRLQMRLTVIKELKVGPYKFRNVPTYLYKDDFNVTNYPSIGGLLGNEVWRRFNMIINYGQREIFLQPNSHFLEPFDYSYTGLGIYYIDGKIMVEDVIEGSPSDKAGILVGDRLIGIGNNLTGNIQQYKNLLLVPNQRIKMILQRNNAFFQVFLKTGTIR